MNRLVRDSNFWNYVLLVNMAFPLYFIMQQPPSEMAPGLLLLAILALLHIIVVRPSRYTVLLISAQFVIIIVLGFMYHPMYTYLVFLIANQYVRLPLRWMIGFAAVFAISAAMMMMNAGLAQRFEVWINMLPPIFGGVALPFVVRASYKYREMAERLQLATRENERLAQQEERQRIAQELHDTLGHTLSLLALKGEVVERMIDRDRDHAIHEARDIQQTATAALRQMRELVSDMKVVRLAEEWEHARALCAAANIRLTIDDDLGSSAAAFDSQDKKSAANLTPLQESVIAMCVREALTNVVRHSGATECTVELRRNQSGIVCTVMDNGSGAGSGLGTAAESGSSSGSQAGGYGIIGMKQRLALLEGSLDMEFGSKGTTLRMHIPVVRRDYGGGSS